MDRPWLWSPLLHPERKGKLKQFLCFITVYFAAANFILLGGSTF